MNIFTNIFKLTSFFVILLYPLQGFSQSSTKDPLADPLFTKSDWSVFASNNPKQCWLVSTPKKSVNTKNGRVVEVTRSKILLYVSFWPETNNRGEVSFTGGYPYNKNDVVDLNIDNKKFELFVPAEGEFAWAKDPVADKEIVAAMKVGVTAIVTGISKRGTQTKDTISLIGFTAALEDAEKRCPQ